ncbi:SLC13 family permease [Roseomonas xinghualingensis]|uniref:SLC13 family permease n=1 Tax=Roseomonas xinghualingensis TaxID=2986475 RepID=UPI0021F2063F|nr:SLC13 family permease [Roseomonas sp. SXEYE001]MCV4208194.1 SLC13 family permease [Roseomonas sp. SXEYE001]
MNLTTVVFILVYVAMAAGHLPGFRLGRPGSALVGAMILIVSGNITPSAAWQAIDYRTICLLFGLMVVSAAFMVAGFYHWVATKVGSLPLGPKTLLAVMIVVSGAMAALLNKDVVAVAMTPILCSICMERRLNPVPFLLGFCFAANFASAATLIGSPQNMIVAEALHLSFIGFLRAAAPPALLGLPIAWIVLVLFYRGRWQLTDAATPLKSPSASAVSASLKHGAPAVKGSVQGDTPQAYPAGTTTSPPAEALRSDASPELNLGETIKAICVTAAILIAFIVTDWPHMLIALGGASFLLISRRVASRDLLHHVDGDLLLLLFGLFVVNAAMMTTGLPQEVLASLRDIGLDLQDPISMLLIMAVLSNVVGNNPAVMLVVPFISGASQPEPLGAAIVLGTALSSGAVIFGSLVGIIVAEECSRRGIKMSFLEFARAGLPCSILCLLLAAAWVFHLSH